MDNKTMTYTQAYQQLQTIVSQMEKGNISVDELQDKIKQANELIQICKQRLSKVEVDVHKLIEDIEKQS